MAKDKSGKSDVTRIDLRIPNHIFEEIEKLAEETNQPLHHISGKVITTPVILNLINLGLESVRKEDFGIESIASKDSLREAEIEKKIINTLSQRLEAIVSDKLTDIIENKVKEAINSLTDNLTEQLTDSKDIDKETEGKEDVTAVDSGDNDINCTLPDNLTDNITINSDLEIENNETNSEKIDPPEDNETVTRTPEIVNESISALESNEDNSELTENKLRRI
ncbi:hypothetical protein [Geminocystis sp. NIES-3709]|uniref:hypothetical protein n=1 Tax=Geminocystis sp. NIES-3709 TaxID=1617448 RepID=UPI0005FCA2C9|nr:hypothetical protein [Geminocystis sp. NIES-3709]BAQ66938.1 hypothetical protein GM3709_3703 [Geminocystis sp. NIES-3709]